MKLLELGRTLRATSSTLMNAESSRSHALLFVTVTQKDVTTLHVRRGKLGRRRIDSQVQVFRCWPLREWIEAVVDHICVLVCVQCWWIWQAVRRCPRRGPRG